MKPKSGVADSAQATLGPSVGLGSGPAPALCGVDLGPGSLTLHSLKGMEIDGKFSTQGKRGSLTGHNSHSAYRFESPYVHSPMVGKTEAIRRFWRDRPPYGSVQKRACRKCFQSW